MINAEISQREAKGDEKGVPVKKTKKMDEISVVQLAWRVANERQQCILQQIQNEHKVVSLKLQTNLRRMRRWNFQTKSER